jgi:hypothetical protein
VQVAMRQGNEGTADNRNADQVSGV